MVKCFDYCKVVASGLCVLSAHLPAYLTIKNWDSIHAPENTFDVKIWILLSTISIDILLLQSIFFAQTLIYMRLKIISMAATLPVFAILNFASAVLHDTYKYKENETTKWLQSAALNINIAERYYGLYLIGYLMCCLRTHFNSFQELKMIARIYMLVFCGLVLGVGFIPIFKGNQYTWWLLLSMLSIMIYVVALITNFVYTPGNFKIFAVALLIGFIPNLFLSIKGISIFSSSQKSLDPMVRYSTGIILNLIWWTVIPSLLIIAIGLLSLLLSLCCKVQQVQVQPQDLLPKQKVKELVYSHGSKDTSNDLENPINDVTNRNDKLVGNRENSIGGECSICWENFSVGQALLQVEGCNHAFHKPCLQQWCDRDPRCPMCRVFIEKNW